MLFLFVILFLLFIFFLLFLLVILLLSNYSYLSYSFNQSSCCHLIRSRHCHCVSHIYSSYLSYFSYSFYFSYNVRFLLFLLFLLVIIFLLLRRSITFFSASQVSNDLSEFHHRYDLGRHVEPT